MLASVERMKYVLSGQFSGGRKGRDTSEIKMYPSEAGKCERMIQYKVLGIPGEPFQGDTTFKMAMGDLLELTILYVAAHAPGVEIVDNNVIRPITIAGRPWRGATDGIHVGDKRRNVEIKSTSKYGLEITQRKGVNDDFGYLSQAAVYMRQLLVDKAIDPPGETIFVYVCRDTMKMWETIVKYEDIKDLAVAADEKFQRVIDAVEAKKLLPRPHVLEAGALGLNCSYCALKHTCWTEPKQVVTFDQSMRPVYREKPTTIVRMEMVKRRPKWFVVDV